MGCLGSSSISILLNGSTTKEFKLKKGLRQDDPLTPFVFLIATERLSRAVRES